MGIQRSILDMLSKVKVPSRYPKRDVKQAARCKTVKFRDNVELCKD